MEHQILCALARTKFMCFFRVFPCSLSVKFRVLKSLALAEGAVILSPKILFFEKDFSHKSLIGNMFNN